MPEKLYFQIPSDAVGERLDKWLVSQNAMDMTRSAIQLRIEQGDVLVDGKAVSKNYRVKADDQIEMVVPEPETLA